MKKILNLNGVQKLNKQEQKSIKGAGYHIGCCPNGNGCRISFGNQSFCEPGRCLGWRGCILY
ncbi:hypothetical protein ABW636_21135 [Aquimarina sp. 2201CG1-2-11]|uniref:hypothetical protein n=1 Tax=Aquimarina discodermiae TaxID=3231043 RepID=UPI0034630265